MRSYNPAAGQGAWHIGLAMMAILASRRMVPILGKVEAKFDRAQVDRLIAMACDVDTADRLAARSDRDRKGALRLKLIESFDTQTALHVEPAHELARMRVLLGVDGILDLSRDPSSEADRHSKALLGCSLDQTVTQQAISGRQSSCEAALARFIWWPTPAPLGLGAQVRVADVLDCLSGGGDRGRSYDWHVALGDG